MKFYSCTKALFVIGFVLCSQSPSLNAQFLGTMTAGHADIAVKFENNKLEPHIHADSATNPPTLFGGGNLAVGEYEADQVWFGIGDDRKIQRSGGYTNSAFDFLGVSNNQDFWMLPRSSPPSGQSYPYLGFATEELNSEWGPVTFTLNNITPKAGTTGSSQFSAWKEQGGNIVDMITTTSGFTNNNKFSLIVGVHEHFNMAFTGQGIFEVAFTVSASRTGIPTPFSASESFTFAVGNANFTAVPEPSSLALIATLSGVGAAWRYRKRLGSKISRN